MDVPGEPNPYKAYEATVATVKTRDQFLFSSAPQLIATRSAEEEQKLIAKCYMCDAEATSMEHVPPRAFFPEAKDLPPGVDLRKDLISVPSCDAHNTKKSKDDEYLAYIIVMHYGNNLVAARQMLTKVLRALEKRPSLRGFFETQRNVILNGAPTIAFKIDNLRYDRELEQIARALYFKTYDEQWLTPMGIYTSSLFELDNSKGVERNKQHQFMHSLAATHLSDRPRLGKNQDVFWYQPWRDLGKGITLLNMCFYGGVSVIAMSSPMVKLSSRKGG